MNKKKLIISISFGIIFVIIILSFYTTFSLSEEYTFKSSIYKIDNNTITDISEKTDVELFYNYFDLIDCSLKVVDDSNKEITSGYIPNGSITILYNKDNKVVGKYTNIIKGDITRDGLVNEDDLNLFGKYLIEDENTSFMESLDINNDNEIRLNDLILLDKTLNSAYQELNIETNNITLQTNEVSRIIAKVKPNFAKNTNLIWTSNNDDIVTVDNSGKVVGHKEGSTTITVATMDKSIIKEVNITVDNTIRLSSIEGIAYVGGDNLEIDIKAVEYSDITCSSNNQDIAICEVKDKKLIIKQQKQGTVEIIVSSAKYGAVTYYLDVMSVYLNVMPRYFCTTPGNVELITISAMNSGDYTFDISDTNVIASAGMTTYNGRNMLKINMGKTAGRATLTVKESHGYQSNQVTIDTYSISIPAIGGVTTIGKDLTTEISGKNLGTLTCQSKDETKATCEISGTTLIVHPLKMGQVTIEVRNSYTFREQSYSCGVSQYLAVIKEEENETE